jgi:hypothetical protein
MSAAEFVKRAGQVEKAGMAGLLSSDARRLRKEIGLAAEGLRDEQDVAEKAGRAPPACLPPKGKAKVDARELVAFLRGLPPADRNLSFRAAFFRYGARKYPCSRS